MRIAIGGGQNRTDRENQPPLMASPGTTSEYKHVGQPVESPNVLAVVDEIPTMTETVEVPLFCESENEVVSWKGNGKVLRLAISEGSMVECDEEVESTWLERGKDGVDCMTDWMVRVDEELAKSGFALTTERRRIVELERRGPILLQIWSPGVGKRPNIDDRGIRIIPMSMIVDERAR